MTNHLDQSTRDLPGRGDELDEKRISFKMIAKTIYSPAGLFDCLYEREGDR